ncbi:hypothetical protein DEI89_17075 [Curtobacterium sp. MCBD17_030]|nr:hypothetical protein DEI89_17075 [Curtobacterium sp. MCBD17_030]
MLIAVQEDVTGSQVRFCDATSGEALVSYKDGEARVLHGFGRGLSRNPGWADGDWWRLPAYTLLRQHQAAKQTWTAVKTAVLSSASTASVGTGETIVISHPSMFDAPKWAGGDITVTRSSCGSCSWEYVARPTGSDREAVLAHRTSMGTDETDDQGRWFSRDVPFLLFDTEPDDDAVKAVLALDHNYEVAHEVARLAQLFFEQRVVGLPDPNPVRDAALVRKIATWGQPF